MKKLNIKMRELVDRTPYTEITNYEAKVTEAEVAEAKRGLERDGWELIEDNHHFFKYAKVHRAIGVMVTTCRYI